MHHRGTFTFYHWLGISVLLHAALVLPFVVPTLHRPERTTHNKLAIELYGMISNRQQEEKRKAGTPIPQRPVPRVTRQKVAIPKQPQPPDKPPMESPVPMETPGPTEEASGSAGASAVFVPAASGSGGSADKDQQRQSIRSQTQRDIIQEYLAMLTKRLRTNLVYPEEVRKKGVAGICTIAFTITSSGDIREGSLRVRKSSGYPALDASALRSARVSAPFEKPPKELTVAIAVSFEVETLRSRTKRASVR
ncbi:MAG: Gram-negative bacterial tonB protein [Syntrophorhabdaceae bacterium PtaU1.Bin034]|nr:MAG: Gram-negative bacterial tonB protein [Syntrophorhabdaceae bacterium PtaU1.Bin034]